MEGRGSPLLLDEGGFGANALVGRGSPLLLDEGGRLWWSDVVGEDAHLAGGEVGF